MNTKNWSKESWKNFPVLQQPEWPDKESHRAVLSQISKLPPLVFAGEIRSLYKGLADAAQGKAFLLQGGDCAEEFASCTAPSIRETLKVILQMAVILTYAGEKPVVKVGRIAGQYAKPRSKPTEVVNDIEIPSYRGDMINRDEPTMEARLPDCNRLLESYFRSASTLNILRAFTRGGFASLDKVHAWNKEFVEKSQQGERYNKVAQDIDKAVTFIKTIGFTVENVPQINEVKFYTSHEALLMGYEESLTRQDSLTGKWYDCSAHMLWIGDRTRQLDGAHVEFFRGLNNPIGIKIGPDHDLDIVRKLLDKLNPDNEWGRITLITRFGKDKISRYLPGLIRGIEDIGARVLWSCDPMHGNTYTSESAYKTRSFADILSEIRSFFEIHQSEGTVPGGVHFELTGEDVTECVGGAQQIEDHQLQQNYATSCDPRLNAQQSLELAFLISEMLKCDFE
ncbi:MAG: 3-deoxy-7-phosphoheptulonate synthase class II [Deltaproteobacteria bacterium]|jgi:3-deoxy-7-phosphoheptulonate synthase|nr:3-deoxy-7-phosphoheptulonate synthase class II [Deltaproteobacteria bacterium]MBT4527554.1 3-deoxy-7-phosphoheptulonate synthase class II [Deltaproteobacteria bacterium]